MPKRTASARGGASRNRPKAQKSIQLVNPNAVVSESETQQDESDVKGEPTLITPPTAKATAATTTATVSKTETASRKKPAEESATTQEAVEETTVPASKGSAAARLAARRQSQGQAALKPAAPRNPSLITAEHYAYVRRDLIYILILAIIMFSTIIILHFVPAIGG